MISICLFVCQCVIGQKVFQPKQVNMDWKGIVYKKERSYDLKMHTNGFAIGANWGTLQTYYRTKYLRLELGYMKDPREKRQNKNWAFPGQGTSSDFIFGKQNTMFVLRGGLGYKKYLSEKTRRRGIAVGYNWEVGPSLALLRPYYLILRTFEETENGLVPVYTEEKYTEDNADTFLDLTDIYGSAAFFDHFNEWSVVPGIQGKMGLHLSLGAFEKYVKAFEVGIMFDAYFKKIPLLVETEEVKNKPYFINLYAHFEFGYRNN